MKNLSVRRNNDDFSLFSGLDNFFRPWFSEELEMKTDVREVEGKYVLDVELPGFDKKDIGITLENEYLNITASKSEESEKEEKDKYLRRERKFGSVSRSFYVGNLKEEDISACYTNGVLTVSFPKDNPPKEDEKKRINIL